MSLWIQGLLSHGFIGPRKCCPIGLWIQLPFVPWVYGSKNFFSHGFMDPRTAVSWVYRSKEMVFIVYELKDLMFHRFMNPITCCPMGLRIQGSIVPWVYGSKNLLSHGFMDTRIYCPMGLWIQEFVFPWVYGSKDLLSQESNLLLSRGFTNLWISFFCESITLAVVSLETSRIISRVFPQDIYHVIYYTQHTVHRINPWIQGFTDIYLPCYLLYSAYSS